MTPAIVTRLQTNLSRAGCDPGGLDGVYGPKTILAQLVHVAGRPLGDIGSRLARVMYTQLPLVAIDRPLRIAHYMTQGAHETEGFTRFVERGNGDGPDADPWDDYLERYDHRADLGNSRGGDGETFRGRGIFQLTGRDNYARMGKRLGVDLLGLPALAATPDLSVRIACLFWDDRDLNRYADNDDEVAVGNGINRGNPRSKGLPIGLDDRRARLKRAKAAWGLAA